MRYLIFLTSLLFSLHASLHARAALELLDRIAVIVDQDVVMLSEINDRMNAVKKQVATQPNVRVPPEDVLMAQVIERLIIESLQLQMAERAGVRISDSELNRTLLGIAAQNQMSLEEFRDTLAKENVSWSTMREQVRREFAISRVQQGVMRRRIRISEQEIKNFLASDLGASLTADQYRLGHILLAFPNKPTADEIREVRNLANHIHQQIQEGTDFSSLAIQWSAGQNALDGGDMGWRKPAQMPSMFSDLVERMETGDVHAPIKSGRGFHLIKLLERRGATNESQVAQTRVRHVLIQPNEIRPENEAQDLARTLREDVVNGRDFEEVAKLHSDDPGSALSGGDLGWNTQGIFVAEFEEVMNKAEVNEVSEVFQSTHGYHFLEITGRRHEDFSEKARMAQAENYLRNQKVDAELESWLREIRDEAFVEIKL